MKYVEHSVSRLCVSKKYVENRDFNIFYVNTCRQWTTQGLQLTAQNKIEMQSEHVPESLSL